MTLNLEHILKRVDMWERIELPNTERALQGYCDGMIWPRDQPGIPADQRSSSSMVLTVRMALFALKPPCVSLAFLELSRHPLARPPFRFALDRQRVGTGLV